MSRGVIYNIQRMSVQDGPGLRTTVFLKGCPLRCLWCSNPESQTFTPQLLLFENLCAGCGQCLRVCRYGAVLPRDGKIGRDIGKCRDCGDCATVCGYKARVMSGCEMSAEDVMEVIRKDWLFYENSGGGVTFGGGEPTAGGEFFLDLLHASHDEGLHVTVDTCGFCPEERFAEITALANLLLFDCKHMDPEEHKKLTGRDNALILRNLEAALSSSTEVRVRMPLIPDLNDSEENLAAMAAFLGKFGRHEVEIMPCHAFGKSKYAALGRPCPAVRHYAPEELKIVKERFVRQGLKPVVV